MFRNNMYNSHILVLFLYLSLFIDFVLKPVFKYYLFFADVPFLSFILVC